ncbi:SDR family NAD(P)-dependent oxidoreductase [Xylanimonas sp. McL0601]|uniref:SDR family NAD(P)-dependent oxidoreductase n=1 Tax=Xylanimonas sp. McL0601 TaxID=3414739 RepID=UPI003CEDD715
MSLSGQIVVASGGSAGIGLETARLARTEGADVILVARNPDRLERAAADIGALRTAAFEATDAAALARFFEGLPAPIGHVMVTAGRPYYGTLAARHPADPPGGQFGRRGGACSAHHDQHRAHRSDLRHRRRPAAAPLTSSV